MSRVALGLLAGAGLVLVGGCDKNCQNTCARIYDPGQCAVQIQGVPAAESQQNCEDNCEAALDQAGSMGAYDPWRKENPLNPAVLENEKQAAAWMDCVWESDCEAIQPDGGGICPPI